MVSHNVPSAHDLELLSAYLDGELSDRERTALEHRLVRETALQHMLDDLRATVAMMRDLPRLKAPRSFALDPAVYGRRIPWWRRWFTLEFTLQFAGAVGTVASVLLIVLALAANNGADDTGSHAANEAAYSAPAAEENVALDATEDTVSLRHTATAHAITWAARTAIVYDGEGLLQTTIEAQTYHYATLEAWDLTVTAEAFRKTVNAPTAGATHLPTVEIVAGGEGTGGAVAEADNGYIGDTTGTGEGLADAADEGEEAESAAESPMPAAVADDVGDADAFEVSPEQEAPGNGAVGTSGSAPTDDIAIQSQAPAQAALPLSPTTTPTGTPLAAQTGQAESATGMAQADAVEDASEDGQAQREPDEDDDSLEETAGDDSDTDTADSAPVPPGMEYADDGAVGMDEAADPGVAMDSAGPDTTAQTNALAPTATLRTTPTEAALVASAPTEEAQAAGVARPDEEPAASASTEARQAADDDTSSSSWMIGLGMALFVVSIVVFVLGRRKARRR